MRARPPLRDSWSLPAGLSGVLPALALLVALAPVPVRAAQTLYLHPPNSAQLNFPALSRIVEEETGLRLKADPTDDPDDDPLESLLDGSADLAIVENTRAFTDGVRTVLPLYEGVVHLSARQDFDAAAYRDRERRPRVEIVNNSHTAALMAQLLAKRSDKLSKDVLRWREGDPGEPDLQFYVGPISPEHTDWFREGFSLIPLGRMDAAGAEFYIEGIQFLIPQLRATRIPALTYSLPGNESGIDALAVDMLLVARGDLKDEVVFDLTATLLEEKARFAAVEPALFRWLRSSFDNDDLAFPLHRGARQYFERDEPGFLERYAETLNFLVYLTVLLLSGLVALGRWRARLRKDRIDAFYTRILDLRTRQDEQVPRELLEELEKMEREAFTALIDERLAADDSFRIFTELAQGLRRDLERRS